MSFTEEKKSAAGENKKPECDLEQKLPAQLESLKLSPAHPSFPYLVQLDDCRLRIQKGIVPGMRVPGVVFVNPTLLPLLLDELSRGSGKTPGARGGFSPSIIQVANVAGLPGIVGHSIAMPDVHAGYGFAIGNVAAVDLSNPEAVVSPGGVGFDINCGVRLIRTNLTKDAVMPRREELLSLIKKRIPVGVGSGGVLRVELSELNQILDKGMNYLVEKGLCWKEDVLVVEENGCMANADSAAVSARAKARGKEQVGSLGSGNHFLELQVVSKVFDTAAADALGLFEGQVVFMLHSGSRGLGHQVCTDFLVDMERAMKDQHIRVNDRQLACARVDSAEGQAYIRAMNAAANFAFVNRSLMTKAVRESFAHVFGKSARELGMNVVYDVCHNMAKIEEHVLEGNSTPSTLLVHRKGATRAFGPGRVEVPDVYRHIGQPVLVAGSMGTASWVLLGTGGAMQETFGSCCHGAGRRLSRHSAMQHISREDVLKEMEQKDITIKVARRGKVAEECSDAYKDVDQVVGTCVRAGIGKRCAKLTPLGVIKA